MRDRKRIIALLSTAMMIFSSGCASKVPSAFPDINLEMTGNEKSDIDITPVNFYFDNIENTKAIDYSSYISSEFMLSVIDTNRSTFSTTDYKLELENDQYSIQKCSKPLEDVYLSENFYIYNSSETTRQNPGILNLLFDDESPSVNMDEINVVFTDLSEKGIDTVARRIHDNYLSSESYNVCFLTVTMDIKDDYQPFYIASGNNNIIKVDAKGIDTRFYYLMIIGPTTKVAAYVHCLKANMENAEHLASSNYEITDYDYVQHSFDIESNLNYKDIQYPNANAAYFARVKESEPKMAEGEESDSSNVVEIPTIEYKDHNEEVFKTNLIRLISKDDYYKRQIWHLEYDKKHINNLYLSPKGYGSSSYDFSLQANLDFSNELDDRIPHYVSIKKKNDGSTVYTGIPDVETITKDDIFFSLGCEEEIKFYTDVKGDWKLLDETRISRFFKSYSTNDGRLNLISDNTDEGGIKNLYIIVPVYQIVVKKNYTLSWIDKRAYIPGQESNALERYRKTFNLRQFYSMLFGINIENKEDNYIVNDTIIERKIMGYARILITGI